jgi:hypothetical protein
MTELEKALKTGRRLTRDGAKAASTALSGGEMMQAAGDVINARLEIMAAGMADPRKVDLTEMSLMSTEKVEALSASASAMAKTFGDIGGRQQLPARQGIARVAVVLDSLGVEGLGGEGRGHGGSWVQAAKRLRQPRSARRARQAAPWAGVALGASWMRRPWAAALPTPWRWKGITSTRSTG